MYDVLFSHTLGRYAEGRPEQQVVQGAGAVKMVALSFHRQDAQSHTNKDQQLIPYAG